MIKTLTPIGDHLGLILDQPILDRLRIDRDTPLEVTTDGKVLVIRPVDADRGARVVEVADRVMDAHEETLRKLAR